MVGMCWIYCRLRSWHILYIQVARFEDHVHVPVTLSEEVQGGKSVECFFPSQITRCMPLLIFINVHHSSQNRILVCLTST